MAQTPTQELQDGFMHDFKKSLEEKPKTPAPRGSLPPLPDMNRVLEGLKKHGDGWGETLGTKGGRKSRSARKKRRKTKKRTHKKRKTKRSKKRRATRSA
jgi:hypothetical protein